MLSYCCLKCRKNAISKNPKAVRTKNWRIILLSKCEVCNSKKLKFVKEQEASRLLCSLGIKAPLNKIPLLCPLLFYEYKMNKIVRFLLAGDRFISEMHLRQPGFTYSACGPFTKNKKSIKN